MIMTLTCLQGMPIFFNLLLRVCNNDGTPKIACAILAACGSAPLIEFTKSWTPISPKMQKEKGQLQD